MSFFKKRNKPASKGKRGFEGAKKSRLYPTIYTQDINEEIKDGIKGLRDVARDLEKNNPYVKRFLGLMETYISGKDGFKLRCEFKDSRGRRLEAINKELTENFNLWSESADASGELSWLEIQWLCVRSFFRDGEFFLRIIRDDKDNPFRFSLEVIDPSALPHNYNKKLSNGNRICMGVEVNPKGRIVNYHFTGDNGSKTFSESAKNVIHIFKRNYAGQLRGYSHLSDSIKKLRMLDGYEEAELVKNRIVAAISAFFVKKFDSDDTYQPSDDEVSFLAEAGVFSFAPPGHEVHNFDPKTPVAAYGDYTKSVKRALSSGMMVGYNELAQDFEGVSYTSLRASSISDRDGYRLIQCLIKNKLAVRVWREWLEVAVLSPGRFRAVNGSNFVDYLTPKFVPRTWPWVDPLKDSRATKTELENMTTSPQRIAAERGDDYEEVLGEIARAEELKEQLGLKDDDDQQQGA